MTLRDYIRHKGVREAARILGISTRAAQSYLYGQRQPRPKIAAQMVRRSKGKLKLTMNAIYGR